RRRDHRALVIRRYDGRMVDDSHASDTGGSDPTLAARHNAETADTSATSSQPRDIARASRPSLPGYSMADVIGRGGMGEIMLARDERIGRDVAIKRMRRDAPEAIERFLREARIQARLEHPAIVPVHEIGVGDDKRPYFTMKRLAGTTLGEQLKTNPLPPQ